MPQPIHIVTASDRNFLGGVIGLVASAARHNPGARFCVLTSGWRPEDDARLVALARRSGCRIDLVPVDVAALDRLPLLRRHLTRATYFRLLLPELMPEVDRVLYMDCDMVVTGPLDIAWSADLAGCPMAAVPCPQPLRTVLRILDLRPGEYVNGGFLVIDLAAWRREGIGTRCLERLAAEPQRYVTEDESAMNDILRGRIRPLPGHFNVYATEGIPQAAFDSPAEIRVLHFIIGKKPWRRPSLFSPVWDHEVAPFRDLLPASRDPREAGLSGVLKRVNRWRKESFMGISPRPSKRRAHALRRRIVELWIPTYLRSGSFAALAAPAPRVAAGPGLPAPAAPMRTGGGDGDGG